MSLRQIPYYRVLHRPHLWLGGEREPALAIFLTAVGLAVTGANLVSFIFAAVLWFGSIPLLRKLAKHDPQMCAVYRQYLTYPDYCPARSGPGCKR